MTTRLSPDAKGIAEAARLLGAGGLVAFATETVYGLGGDARNGQAVASIFEAKGRPSFNPLIVHVADFETALTYGDFSDNALALAQAFWPGPLTLVVPLKPKAGLSSLVTAGNDTVALRVPAHPLAQHLLTRFGGPVAAPSANPSGKISPTTADHVLAGLSGRIAAVLDGGPTEVGLESTIIGFDPVATHLRAGGLPKDIIERALGVGLAVPTTGHITAPGQLASHYAPTATLRLNATKAGPGERLLGFGTCPEATLNLSSAGDLREAAAKLFTYLHKLDETPGPIAVSPIPDHGLGQAINDRLNRAAAPRPT